MKMKRILRNVVIACALVAALSVAVNAYWAYVSNPDPNYLFRVAGYVQQNGITPGLDGVLKESPVRAGRWQGCVIRVRLEPEGRPNVSLSFWDEPVACYPQWQKPSQPSQSNGLPLRLTSPATKAPDGQSYLVAVWAEQTPAWLVPFLICEVLGLLLAALSLALWIFADARERKNRAPAAWLLLGLLTGPVGLAVWLVVRGEPVAEHCPGCGADRVPETAYCVRCGRPLLAVCPSCAKRVEVTWSHCGACGAPLDGKGGGGDGLLADENGA